ncbi:YihY/virulence factor BrkB family protein [Enterovirga rhinocerotis]|uniref:Membrane protein n=1 Tax=Enterovirga rhinocerotis TaxID=1339210 RepID=A0A4R7C450_9HYPH|nr:YihY/virulence factor BrkB family protein [Enterovirga rhinocerotis]TDR93244.1 membrane protein [Enterovirga rhinocerotis]
MPDPSSSPVSSQAGGSLSASVGTLAAAFAIVGAARLMGGASRRPVEAGDPVKPRGGQDEWTTRAAEPGRGRQAEHPVAIPPRGWWDIASRVFDSISRDRILAVAAGVAFYGLLALFPAIGAFVALYGLVADPATIAGHLTALSGFLPDGAIDIVGEQVKRLASGGETALGVTFFVSFGISLWSANAGMKAMFDALNVAYREEEKRNIVVLNLWSLAFTFAAIAFLVLALVAVVVIPVVLQFVGLGSMAGWIVWAGRWPALALLTFVAISILYRYGASRRRARWLWLSPGAIFATLGWMGVSMLFSWYVANFGSYNETYGSLGAVIGFMTWMWLSATVVLVGAEISAETEHQTARDTTDGPPRPIGKRGARMADSIGVGQ